MPTPNAVRHAHHRLELLVAHRVSLERGARRASAPDGLPKWIPLALFVLAACNSAPAAPSPRPRAPAIAEAKSITTEHIQAALDEVA